MQHQSEIAPTLHPTVTAPPSRSLLADKGLDALLAWAAVVSLSVASLASAQTAAQTPAPTGQTPPQAPQQAPKIATVTQTITVTADNQLLEPEATGSRLGLTPLQTPAQVFSITPDTIERRGYTQIEDAVDSLPGVTSGGSPADPSQFVVRGFVGNYVSLLRDGIYVGPANMVTRAVNTFNLQSVDLLSGPSSVLYGQGAVGGTVNLVTKKPIFAPTGFDAYSEVGSFSTFAEGFGAGGQITKTFAYRSDFSYYQSHTYVVNGDPKNLNGTASLLYAPTKKLSFLLALDVLKDKLSSYYGTPMVTTAFATSPLTGVISDNIGLALDSRMRFNNYNVGDAVLSSSTYQPSLTIAWQPSPALAVTNQTYYYHAARNWMNAEQYIFIPVGAMDGNGGIAPINEIERDRFQVHHNENLPGDSLNFAYAHKLFGLDNKVAAGYEFYHVGFSRARGFNFANNYADFVDALHPVQGLYADPYDPGDNAARIAPTRITDNAVYAEDSLKLAPKLNVVAGLHFENFYLDRLNFGPTGAPQTASNFSGTYHPFNFRVGAVYDLYKGLTAYGQFTTASAPPGSNIFLVNAVAGAPFRLSPAKEGEIGLKDNFPRGFGEMTLALYDISVSDILTVTQNSASSNNGQQKSRGVEFSTILHPVHFVDVNFNTAYTHAKFGYFFDPNTNLNDTGLVPADVPTTSANLWVDTRKIGALPLEVGAGLRFLGARYANNQNTITLDNYATFDVYATYRLKEKFDFSARGKNLTNKAYASFADINYPTEIILGAPRSYMLSFTGHF
jgi:iron complex outermembrane receptor protein